MGAIARSGTLGTIVYKYYLPRSVKSRSFRRRLGCPYFAGQQSGAKALAWGRHPYAEQIRCLGVAHPVEHIGQA